ncbi:aminodeoxychorismate synthase component I [Xinfangfangia sp. D13-10-4-6]|uniref:aminodeoxychorismate synthase component I n=1 Tax=Pseudogemmobacter hezensis TaxID=2737662 RepID=UPI001553301C|nr:aminodeoxychorismate synthase component I [Pseudogemmobacter hezensis]NPD14574.1 aminodeoxychorismate synthase component I [Pseudogemmobacter hezensis]
MISNRRNILFEHGPGGQPALFDQAMTVKVAHEPHKVAEVLLDADRARRAGAWIAGYISYEAGYAFEDRLSPLTPKNRRLPLVHLATFMGPSDPSALLARMEAEAASAQISAPQPLISRADYDTAITRVLDLIAAGDIYQANLTFPLAAQLLSGTPEGLYGRLRRSGPVGHGAFVNLVGEAAMVSRSPELFFRVDADGRITTRPMKGTRPRDPDPARDAALAQDLHQSPKDRAENLMIVDLLRNDISRISQVGSVKVPSLYAVEHYATVHQMVSEVQGQLASPPSLPDLIRALFPCGSVTGAPKIRAMEVIREVEPFARDVYCGAIGWMAPDGRADFSVAIRTLTVDVGDGENGAASAGEIRMNVGGGVVHGSTPDGEWEEALWKARFVKAAVTPDCG